VEGVVGRVAPSCLLSAGFSSEFGSSVIFTVEFDVGKIFRHFQQVNNGSFHMKLTSKSSVLTLTMPDWSYLIFSYFIGTILKKVTKDKKI
jgi:hypothetical protein